MIIKSFITLTPEENPVDVDDACLVHPLVEVDGAHHQSEKLVSKNII
jgi:hypothetical protein